MYTIIGGDGTQYGPVTTAQVRQWMAEGRANLQTAVKVLGSEEWRRIGELAEFNGGAQAPSVAAAPAEAPGGPAGGPIDIISCYERGWALLKANFWPLVGANALIMIVRLAASMVPYVGFLTIFIVGILQAGLYAFVLKLIRGEGARIGDVFCGFSRTPLTLAVAYLLALLLTAVATVFLILPGIYLAVAYAFVLVLVIDRDQGIWESLETSRKVVSTQWFRVFGLVLLAIPILLLGVLALGVGLFVAMPLIMAAFLYAYEDLFGRPPRRP